MLIVIVGGALFWCVRSGDKELQQRKRRQQLVGIDPIRRRRYLDWFSLAGSRVFLCADKIPFAVISQELPFQCLLAAKVVHELGLSIKEKQFLTV